MGTTPKSHVWGFAGCMLLALLLMSFSPAYGETISETFTNNKYDTNLWYLDMGQGTMATIANNELEVTVGGPGYGNFSGNFTLTGDFTMTVDFTLINWPPNNGTQLGIGTYSGSSSPFQVVRCNTGPQYGGVEKYFTLILGQYTGTNGITGPTDSGKLRMVRTGNTMVGSYYDGSNWIAIGSDTNAGLGGPVSVWLGIGPNANNYSRIPAKAAFDNIQIQGNTNPVPVPGALLLFGTGLLGLGAHGLRRRPRS